MLTLMSTTQHDDFDVDFDIDFDVDFDVDIDVVNAIIMA
jgi:hypothetical protein